MLALLSPTKIRRVLFICLFIFILPSALFAQNLFLQKVEMCNITNYCMDCGDPKASCDQLAIDFVSARINNRYLLKEATGSITFQVLVDERGFSCVLSHNDASKSALTNELITYLNGCIWKPAKVDGKPVASSVNVIFRFISGGVYGQVQRLDLAEMKPAGDPTIYNKTFTYTNPSLKNYDFTVWTKYNSPLVDNIAKSAAMDQSDLLWYATEKGMTRFEGTTFIPVNEYNSPFPSDANIKEVTIDRDNNKWVYYDNKIFMYGSGGWQLFDFKQFLAGGVNQVLNSRNGELLFTTQNGLVVKRKDKVVVINKKSMPEMPSSNVLFAYVDSQKRLWIGTSKGTIMIDKSVITSFNSLNNTPLKNASISGAVEDEKGNVYFSLVDCNKQTGENDSDKEGIAVLKFNGNWLHYNDKNSGMPANHVNTMLYDKFEHVLWLGTDESGIARFDLNSGWENYHNNNSPLPGFTIYQIVQDSKGIIYATTANGLLRIRKKAGA
ncbi:ligand-binding sensor domain-containing protein [Mucilaginibacter sp. 3215]|uniref:ligand-binding sensor domain-containing protein n=1 Tax=Mucilaginibacter sp. 3215 TaxID=3373912 RepID=UPI003D2075A0